MLTPWGETLDKSAPLREYPRPQLRRESYLNLNGPWDCAFTASREAPERFDGVITVPFSPESELSGVNRQLNPGEYLWYRRTVTLPEGFRRDRLLLHFGAVDQIATVFVDGNELKTHVGGFTPFTVDLSAAVKGERFTLAVRVQDFTDRGYMTRGKQRLRPGGIWYRPQSGIWQTVWMESTPENYIKGLRLIPHFDERQLELWVAGEGTVTAELLGRTEQFEAGSPALLDVSGAAPWSPEEPVLHDLTLRLGEDRVESYFALRKISVEADETGTRRIFLNGKPCFQSGILDQGYWSDGLLTAPSDEAMVFDISLAKRMGFNMLRKHVKIEPLRWYYHCDRLGMLVWQDMPNGGTRYRPGVVSGPLLTGIHLRDSKYGLFGRRKPDSRTQYLAELREMLGALYNCPCIVVWTPFNEGWGQFDAKKVCQRIRDIDASRLIDHASGWHDQGGGDLCSLHVYLRPYRQAEDPYGRAVVLSEFGGCSYRIEGHCAGPKTFGYKKFDSANSYKFALRDLYGSQIAPARAEGLSAAVYTQLSDVEDELNGLVTYDRKVVKIAPELLRGMVKAE